jgi:hypothetical protein
LASGQPGAPGVQKFLVCASNAVIALPAELQDGTGPLRTEIVAYLRHHGRDVEWMDLYESNEWLAARGPMPLVRLFGEVVGSDAKEVHDFYATSWALVHYLLGTPRGRDELSRFEKELAGGVPLDVARERAFGRSFEALAEELSTYINYLMRGVSAGVVLDPRRITIADPPAPAPLAPSEAARELGSLALTLSDENEDGQEGDLLALSRSLLDTAVAGNPANAHARAGLAYSQALSGDAESAREGVARALGDAPQQPEVLWRAGQIALAEGDLDEAEARFRGALALDARFASAWLGLGRALARRGAANAALDAFEHPRSLAWSAGLDLEIGQLHLAAGRRDDALATLQPLARDPHGGRVADRPPNSCKRLASSRKRPRTTRTTLGRLTFMVQSGSVATFPSIARPNPATIPEPGTAALLALGLTSFGVARRSTTWCARRAAGTPNSRPHSLRATAA